MENQNPNVTETATVEAPKERHAVLVMVEKHMNTMVMGVIDGSQNLPEVESHFNTFIYVLNDLVESSRSAYVKQEAADLKVKLETSIKRLKVLA